VAGTKALWKQQIDRLAEQIAARVAGHALQFSVCEDQLALGVGDGDANRDSVCDDCGVGFSKSVEIVEHFGSPNKSFAKRRFQGVSRNSRAFRSRHRFVRVQNRRFRSGRKEIPVEHEKYDHFCLDLQYTQKGTVVLFKFEAVNIYALIRRTLRAAMTPRPCLLASEHFGFC
jgi:hypothetical protein